MTNLDRYLREVSEHRLPILARVESGSRVLDVGSWTGAHGRWLIENAGASVDGVELDPAAGAEAQAQGYEQVLIGSIEQPALQLSLHEYDAILFLDVLEHLSDPAAVLRAAKAWLRPAGIVLCSIPNVAHWRVRVSLALGRFEYEDSGLLDRTHLRWFTRKTARELVSDAGYRITWEGAAVPQPPHVRVPERLLRPELFAYQFFLEGAASAPG